MDSSMDSEMVGSLLYPDQNVHQVAAAGIHFNDNTAYAQTCLAEKSQNILESSLDTKINGNTK